MKPFQLIIIGDEILYGERQDKHFAFFKNLLREHGLQLASVLYLPDERAELVQHLRTSFAQNLPTFITGGIGGTPDDHTRQAAAQALNLPLVRHPEAAALINQVSATRGDAPDSAAAQQRLNMADFPQGAALIPNPYNNIAGFSYGEHYFLPGFPVMAHPMAQWVLQTYYANWFHQTERAQKSVWLLDLPESKITALMNEIEQQYTGIQTFSLPSVGDDNTPAHIEFGLKAQGQACEQLETAWQYVTEQLVLLGGKLQRLPESK
ncbi:competence/damage-inducible protein A [Neisseriaceae bacterium B1]